MSTCTKCEGEGGITTKRCEECISKSKETKTRAAPARSGSDPVQPANKLFRTPALRSSDTKFVPRETAEGGGGSSSAGGGGGGGGGGGQEKIEVSMVGVEEMMKR